MRKMKDKKTQKAEKRGFMNKKVRKRIINDCKYTGNNNEKKTPKKGCFYKCCNRSR